jgi:hypothetical protein
MPKEKNPGIAMLLSAIFPGVGQLYAEAFWSAVLIWAAYFFLVAALAFCLVTGSALSQQLSAMQAAHTDGGTIGADLKQKQMWFTVGLILCLTLFPVLGLANIYDARQVTRRHNAKTAPETPETRLAAIPTESPAPNSMDARAWRLAAMVACGLFLVSAAAVIFLLIR